MASSCKPGPLNPPAGVCRIAPRTPGLMGVLDQGDPNWTTLLGDSPGVLGYNDWGVSRFGRTGPNSANSAMACFASDRSAISPSVATAVVVTKMSWDDVKPDFLKWEGLLTHMYLDSVGKVTVGVGNMIPDAAAAQKLAFVRRADGRAATASEISTEFETVDALDDGYRASWYRDKTTLDLPEFVCWSLIKVRYDDEFIPGLKSFFTHWEFFPLVVKRALLDMAYNLGFGSAKRGNGLAAFKGLKKSVDTGDWALAATQCHRRGIPEDRNAWARDLFLSAQAKAK